MKKPKDRPPWRRKKVVASNETCARCPDSTPLIAVWCANTRGIRSAFYVCPTCDIATPLTVTS